MQRPNKYEARPDKEYTPKGSDPELTPADAPSDSSGDEERPPDVPVEN